MKKLLIILYIVAMVVIGALADGLFDDGLKVWGHALGAVEVGLLLSCAFLFNLTRREYIPIILSYIFIRVAAFDMTYNLVSGLPINFTGSTSLWDQFIDRIPPHGLVFARGIFLLSGIGIIFNEL